MEYYTNALSWLTTASADFNKFTMVGWDSFTPILLSAMQMAHLTSSDIYLEWGGSNPRCTYFSSLFLRGVQTSSSDMAKGMN